MFQRLVAALVTLIAACAAAAAPARHVEFDSVDGAQISAALYLPDGPPKGSVIALHGCGGLYVQHGPRKGALNAQYQELADLLVAQGYAVLLPDSLGPRGATEVCTESLESRRIGQFARRGDALGAMTWVADQPWAAADRIALLGWSDGGSAVPAATDSARHIVRHHPVRPAVAIAFSPACSTPLQAGYRPSAPLVLVLTERDSESVSNKCVELAKAAGAQVQLVGEGTHRADQGSGTARDRRSARRRERAIPNAAREQAYARVIAVLAHALR